MAGSPQAAAAATHAESQTPSPAYRTATEEEAAQVQERRAEIIDLTRRVIVDETSIEIAHRAGSGWCLG